MVSETSEKQMRESIRHEVCPTSEAEVVQETIGTETVAVLDKGSVSTEKLSKKKRKVKRVRYEVNCGDITDLDMIEFVRTFFSWFHQTTVQVYHLFLFQQTFMRSEVKVAGAKNSPYLKVSLQGKKIIFKSKRFVAKKSVRFSARKYFKNKKNRSVCVVNESRNSYKLTVKL